MGLHICYIERPKTATRASNFFQNIWPLSKSTAKHKQVPKTKLLKPTGDKSTSIKILATVEGQRNRQNSNRSTNDQATHKTENLG
jgi:hypothetical protein